MKNKHIQQVDFSNPNANKITSGTTNKPVENRKTAMLELIDEIVEHLTYDDKLSEDSRITYETIRLRCLSKLTKEKEQMQKTYSYGWTTRERFDDLVPDIIYPLGLDYEEKQEYAFEQYYNKNYEQTR